jgi:hypothetical protein
MQDLICVLFSPYLVMFNFQPKVNYGLFLFFLSQTYKYLLFLVVKNKLLILNKIGMITLDFGFFIELI